MISDGQSWSGKVAAALQEARRAGIPVHVVGIGTTVGGMIPEPMGADGVRPPPVVRSALDRASLVQLAVAGGGEYFEIGDEPDRVVAFRIIDRLRKQNNLSAPVETLEELYPRFLFAAAVVLGLGLLFVRKPLELVWHGLGVAVAGCSTSESAFLRAPGSRPQAPGPRREPLRASCPTIESEDSRAMDPLRDVIDYYERYAEETGSPPVRRSWNSRARRKS